MDVEVADSPIEVTGPNLKIVLNDDGGAHVSLVLAIAKLPPIRHDETYEGSRTELIKDLKEGSYPCKVMIAAYKYKAVGPTYDASIRINNKVVARAEGAIKKGEWSDFGYGAFTLEVS